ncbi:hypothetical protein RND71_037613 [Anisodus tanguticus]|uniref:Uncharacterized protein n=1 Tax=Anisodus tanguticus TaxID=243964 RepID=A0AAE1USS0_9SOLA|nr:hypothetical protein RND71_037613 [Anisodus tanguticus]
MAKGADRGRDRPRKVPLETFGSSVGARLQPDPPNVSQTDEAVVTHVQGETVADVEPGPSIKSSDCKPSDEAKWRRRLKRRSEVDGSSLHKSSTWQEMEKLLEGYERCWDYDVGVGFCWVQNT